MLNYSIDKKGLTLASDKRFPNEHVYITHYLRNYKIGIPPVSNAKGEGHTSPRIENLVSSRPHIKATIQNVPFPPPSAPLFKFIDLFAGIGGFRIALQRQGGECVFSSEINKAAKATYESNFGELPFGDIRDFTGPHITDQTLNDLIPDHQVLTAGFPCQPFSLAGVSARNYLGQVHGFSDTDKGNLFFDIARIVKVKKPLVVFLENVKNFRRHDHGNTFNTVKKTLEDLGYHFFCDTINAETWVPQQRQRFFMVCIKKERPDEAQPFFYLRERRGSITSIYNLGQALGWTC